MTSGLYGSDNPRRVSNYGGGSGSRLGLGNRGNRLGGGGLGGGGLGGGGLGVDDYGLGSDGGYGK